MLEHAFGWPQTVALLVLVQRGLEEVYSQHNTRALLRRGGYEVGRDYYPVVAATHLGWIAGLAFLLPADAPVHLPFLVAFLVLQPLRYWIIATLGPYWTHRVITLPRAPVIARGPYRLLRHPNYAVTLAETLVLPLAFGQVALAVIFAAIWAAVLQHKIVLEEQALAERRSRTAMAR